MDPKHLVKCISNVFKSRGPGACVGANDGSKLTASFMEIVLVNTGTDGAVAERMLTPKDDQNVPPAVALCHAIATLADKDATLERPDDKLREFKRVCVLEVRPGVATRPAAVRATPASGRSSC